MKKRKELLNTPSLIKDPNYKRRVLVFDIENAPILSYTWGIWQQDVIEVIQDWYILCFAYKWLGEKETHVVAQPDFKGYKKDMTNDEYVVKKLWELFDEAEVIVAHNGDAFDIKKANARFVQHGLEPPSKYKTVDTLKIARQFFKFSSNKLDDLGRYLNIGRKVQHTGKHLWLSCMKGDKESWKLMKEYNIQDVLLLEKVYYKLRGWAKSSPNMNMVLGTLFNCPTCGSPNVVKKGFEYTKVHYYQAYKCNNCGRRFGGERMERDKPFK